MKVAVVAVVEVDPEDFGDVVGVDFKIDVDHPTGGPGRMWRQCGTMAFRELRPVQCRSCGDIRLKMADIADAMPNADQDEMNVFVLAQ